MWDTILIAAIPTAISIILTNYLNKQRHLAEIESIKAENKSKETNNLNSIMESYNIVLTQYKVELVDSNNRLSEYIKNTNEREEQFKKLINKMEVQIIALHKDNKVLKEKVRILSDDICKVRGISRDELFKDVDQIIDTNYKKIKVKENNNQDESNN